jgi:hypothetical protein
MTKKQQALYDKTCEQIRERYGSTHAIAVRSVMITDEVISGETVRTWFRDRTVPTDFAFVLYLMMDREIDPLALCPHLRRFVVLKDLT